MSGLGVLSGELGAGVASRLAVLERDARGLRAPAQLAQVRAELMDIARMWRRLVTAHCPAEGQSRCPRCRGWWGRRRWPCEVWAAAHAVLLEMDLPQARTRVDEVPASLAGTGATTPAGPTIRARAARLGWPARGE